ncbi:glycoside hydrolase family 28 protein [Candidatus Neomarinimicrobiota bacterium]
MYHKFHLISGLILISLIGFAGCTPDHDLSYYTDDIAFEMPAFSVPQFPSNTENIVDHGAVGDGRIKNTEAIARTIDAVVKTGGGTVYIPAGIWLTGPVQLQSNINLHLAEGALLQFTSDFEDYPLIRGTWEGRGEVRCISPIFGQDLENIAITGKGIIDGAGDGWRPVKKYKLTDHAWQQKLKTGVLSDDGEVWWPSEGAKNGGATVARLNARGDATVEEYAAAHKYLRPVMINLVNCKNVLLDGPTFQNSPAWNIHPLMCENMVIRNITVLNPWYSQNGDGLDLESCRNVIVYNCSFDVGDDAICLKSGKNEYGRERGMPSENIVIADCIVYHGHGGFTVGSEMSGGVRNIDVRRCTFLGTDVGLRFKSTRGRGGVVEKIYIQDILMKEIPMEALRFNLFYDHKEPIPAPDGDGMIAIHERPADPVTEETPSFRDIHISRITCMGASQAIMVQGLPEMAVKDVELSHLNISADKGAVFFEVDGITISESRITPAVGPAYSFLNARNIAVSTITPPETDDRLVTIAGPKSSNINLEATIVKANLELLNIGPDVPENAVTF